MSTTSEFGKQMLQLFAMDEKYININHASVGLEPIHITQKRLHYIAEINKNNELWFRYLLPDELLKNRQAIANYVGCDVKELAFVRNATESFADAIAAIDWKEGDTLLYTNIAYLAMRNQMKHLIQSKKVKAVELTLTKELLNDREKLLEFFEEHLKLHSSNNLKAFQFDHISSCPSFIWPIKEIAALCKKYNCLSICDGAQAVGQIPVNIHEAGVDFYTSNMHKWGFTPRPFAFIFIKESLQKGAHPAIISNNYGDGFEIEFNRKGTDDPSPYLTAVDALAFRNLLGEQRILKYNRNLAFRAGQIFSETWGTPMLIANKDYVANLVSVEVPRVENLQDMLKIVTKLLMEQHFYLVHYSFDGKIYVRISANIYNEESDYSYCSSVALSYINRFYEKSKETNTTES